jgi:uncharacterized protein (DUF1501 family)
MKRRDFIKSGALALGSFTLLPGLLKSGVVPSIGSSNPILVAIFLRGGADGLNVVVPYADSEYYNLRSTIAIAEPGKKDGALDLDGFFGLHPRLDKIHSLFQQRSLAVVHACGSHNETRSHFDAMDYMESGSSEIKLNDGWINRYLSASKREKSVFRAVALGPSLPFSMAGAANAISLSSLETLQLRDSPRMTVYLDAIVELNIERDDFLGEVAFSALEAIEAGKIKLDPEEYKPKNGADYGNGPFGLAMKDIAQIIKADIGLEVATTDLGGWDTHTNQGAGASGALADVLGTLNDGVFAFVTDLGNLMDRVVILIMTEFGRTADQNGSGGTDHGHGTAMFVAGGGVKGGVVYSQWPGLKNNELYEGRDLAITTDFRRIFGEVLVDHMGCADVSAVFPGYDYAADPQIHLFS